MIMLHSMFNKEDIIKFSMKFPTTIPFVIVAALFREPAAAAADPPKGICGGKNFLKICVFLSILSPLTPVNNEGSLNLTSNSSGY